AARYRRPSSSCTCVTSTPCGSGGCGYGCRTTAMGPSSVPGWPDVRGAIGLPWTRSTPPPSRRGRRTTIAPASWGYPSASNRTPARRAFRGGSVGPGGRSERVPLDESRGDEHERGAAALRSSVQPGRHRLHEAAPDRAGIGGRIRDQGTPAGDGGERFGGSAEAHDDRG